MATVRERAAEGATGRRCLCRSLAALLWSPGALTVRPLDFPLVNSAPGSVSAARASHTSSVAVRPRGGRGNGSVSAARASHTSSVAVRPRGGFVASRHTLSRVSRTAAEQSVIHQASALASLGRSRRSNASAAEIRGHLHSNAVHHSRARKASRATTVPTRLSTNSSADASSNSSTSSELAALPWTGRLLNTPSARLVEVAAFGIYSVPVLVVAFLYNRVRMKKDLSMEKPREADNSGFHHGLFGCLGECRLTVFSCCCFAVRWADTMDKARPQGTLLKFWSGILMMLALGLFGSAIGSFFAIYWNLWVAILVLFRQRLRNRYNLEAGTCQSIAEDCFAWWCCPCCAVVQEARHVEGERSSEGSCGDGTPRRSLGDGVSEESSDF
eukprot:TRINITY_DN8972_c0_g1_i1.p1 TRINITY_DN8972_c0_g1~~TRINITY_DN8972_c0_g1_i1.p1  ORF type:complete len:396 (-),score=45.32 TRINITY_DN8972_c0_g1_i1:91-1245(-)